MAVSRVYRFGGFTLDPHRRILRRGSVRVHLAGKTLDTLIALVRRHGEIVGKAELLESVWPDCCVEEINLHVHVSALRKLFGETPRDHRFIVTVPRTGYRFVAGVEEVVALDEAGSKDPPRVKLAGKFRHAAWAIFMTALVIIAFAQVWLAAERSQATLGDPDDPRAFTAYQRGLHFWNQRTVPALRRSVEYFDAAVTADSRYAPAMAARADALNLLALQTDEPVLRANLFERARSSADAALAIDDRLSTGHAALATIAIEHDGDFDEAADRLRRALESDPLHPTANQRYAWFTLAMGDSESAVRHIETAVIHDPLSIVNNVAHCAILYLSRRFAEAEAVCRATLELEPGDRNAREYLALAMMMRGELEAAILELERVASDAADDPLARGALGHALAMDGQTLEAERLADRLLGRSGDALSRYARALILSGLRDRRGTVADLEAAARAAATPAIPFWLDPRLEWLGQAQLESIAMLRYPTVASDSPP